MIVRVFTEKRSAEVDVWQNFAFLAAALVEHAI
jgi:hypothetical protein